eukprot:11490526-Alexandrium_andersonii.AAC.1
MAASERCSRALGCKGAPQGLMPCTRPSPGKAAPSAGGHHSAWPASRCVRRRGALGTTGRLSGALGASRLFRGGHGSKAG